MKTILITGGSGSIGKGIAEVLLEKNYKVVLIGRDIERLVNIKNELIKTTKNQHVETFSMDITNEKQVVEVIAKIWENHSIDALINAAGIGEPIDYFKTTDADWMECIQTKLLGTIKTTREVSKLMAQHGRKGNIIIINGTFCYDPHPDFIINSTVNSALSGFTKAASKYLGNKEIRLNTINPWITESESWQNTAKNLANLYKSNAETLNKNFKEMNPLKQFTQVNDIGQTVAFLLSDHAQYINGASINLDGGASVGY
ncbi:SDR family oxidoreductase [Orbus sturtevantii]|uniref:SDR family oxidoreductase n=1 Tax=Orbus sturtevantii TaxID=3074109 RepID=UPI00370D379E